LSGNKIDIEEEVERILAAPLYKPGEYVPEEEHSEHHFIDAPTEKCIKCISNLPATAKEDALILEKIDCDKNVHITKEIHQLLNRFFKKSLLPYEVLGRVDSIFNMECYGINNKERLMKKLDVVAFCSYTRKHKEFRLGTKKLGDVKNLLVKKVEGNFKTRELLPIFGVTTDDVKVFLESYFIYPEWRDFSEQWEIIARNRDKVVFQNNGKKNKKTESENATCLKEIINFKKCFLGRYPRPSLFLPNLEENLSFQYYCRSIL